MNRNANPDIADLVGSEGASSRTSPCAAPATARPTSTVHDHAGDDRRGRQRRRPGVVRRRPLPSGSTRDTSTYFLPGRRDDRSGRLDRGGGDERRRRDGAVGRRERHRPVHPDRRRRHVPAHRRRRGRGRRRPATSRRSSTARRCTRRPRSGAHPHPQGAPARSRCR